jgi:hypothetical protein
VVAVQSIIAALPRFQVDDENQEGGNRDPKELVPIKKRKPEEGGLSRVVERNPEQGDERHEQEDRPPAQRLFARRRHD